MKQTAKRALSMLLSLVMVFGLISMISFTAFAAEAAKKLNTYDTVSSTLAPGVTQTVNQAYRDDGKYVKYFVATVDLSNPDVGVQATYGGAQGVTPGVTKMTDQIKDMTAKHTNPDDAVNYIENYAIVAGVNGDGYNVGTGQPSGVHIMNGVVGFGIAKAGNSPWFAWFEDGTAACGRNNTDWDAAVAAHGAAKEAIGGFQLLMKDGKIYEPSANTADATKGGSNYWRPGFDYPCSFVGVTHDNKLVLMNCNGNNMGGSAGFDYDYTIDAALKLGLKDLLCLDGGGSATYLARPEGEKDVKVVSMPSDGSERAVANGLVIYSTVPPSDVFKSAVLKTEATHYTPCSEIEVTASGVSPAGTPAEIPADIQWALSDDSFGTIADGVFTSTGKTGKVKVQMVYENAVVGEVEVNIVNPTTVDFEQESMVVPFGKTAKVKMTTNYLDPVTGGNFPVEFKVSDFTFTFSKENAGSLNGFELIAPEGGDTAVTLNAVYKHCEMPAMSIAVSYGKASEVIWDFEDGDVSDWLGWSDACAWVKENAPNSALGFELAGKDNEINGQAPEGNDSYTFLATADNGQVRSGKYALGFTLDETHYSGYGQWEYNILFNVGQQKVFRDVKNGLNATTVGMWIYLPEDQTGVRYTGDTGYFAMEGQWYCGSSADKVEGYRVRNIVFQDTGKTMAATTDGGYTEVGKWVYMSADISAYDYVATQVPTANVYREPCFIRFYFKDLEPNKYTFYFDDFTLDYSSAVEDRDAPVISNPKYVVVDNGVDFTTTCASNKVLFTANIADVVKDNTSGLNYASAKIYVDGVALDNVKASGNAMTSEEVTLTAGKHEVIFEIADNMGTITRNKEILTVSAGNKPIWIAGHNDSGALAEYDSIYYMDLKVADAAAIDTIETEITLNFANTWQLPYMNVAEGFKVAYEFVELTNSVKLTITREADCALSGEQALVSIPVRIWSFPENRFEEAKKMSTSGDRPIVPVDFEVEYGKVTYTAGNYAGYMGVFYDYFTTLTKIQDQTYAWHLTHTAKAVADKAATCTEAGYTGRTYCDVCKSVVSWGTIVPATGHTYAITDGVLKCACGETFTGTWTDGKEYVDGVAAADGWNGESYYQNGKKLTGIQMVDGFYYDFGEDGVCAGKVKFTGLFFDESVSAYRYSKLGELYGGWIQIDEKWHCFFSGKKVAVTGEYTINGVTFQFDETGKTDGAWATDENGTRYWYGPSYYLARSYDYQTFVEIDGKTYNFNEKGYVTPGVHALRPAAFIMKKEVFEFDQNGVLVRQITEQGIIECADGMYYINEEGFAPMDVGLVKYGNDFYYILYSGKLKTNGYGPVMDYSKVDASLVLDQYYFGEDGKMVIPEIKEGIVFENGSYYYYVGGILQKDLGLVKIGDDFYYIAFSGKIKTNGYGPVMDYSKVDASLVLDQYYFGEDGKMVIPEIKEGIVFENDNYYYYVGGVLQKDLGLVKIGDDFYYIAFSGKIKTNGYGPVMDYSKVDASLVLDQYYFGEDGKMVIPEIKEGIVFENGNYYYYVGGVLQKDLGLVKIGDDFYYIAFSGKIKTNGYGPVMDYSKVDASLVLDQYYFGEDGKMIIPEIKEGIVFENGNYYYYVGGVLQKDLGLVKIGDDFYYIAFSGKIKTNGYGPVMDYSKVDASLVLDQYYFGEDGKMVIPEIKEGIVFENGNYYYYVGGVLQKDLGLVKIGDDFYYIAFSGKIKTNGYGPVMDYSKVDASLVLDQYYFGEDGKMVIPEIKDGIVFENGNYYYYINNVMQKNLGLVKVDGDVYYVNFSGKLKVNGYGPVTDYTVVDSSLTEAQYFFGADAKLVK